MNIFSRLKVPKPDISLAKGKQDHNPRTLDVPVLRAESQKTAKMDDPKTEIAPTEDQILEALPPGYFKNDFDAVRNTLENLAPNITQEYLDGLLESREQAVSIVTTRLHKKVMDNHASLLTGMARVREFSDDLTSASEVSKSGRQNLRQARKNLTELAFKIMVFTRRRFLLTSMVRRISGLAAMLDSDQKLEAAVNSANFPLAVEVCRRCRFETERSRHFKAAEQLMNRYEEMFDYIELQIESALGKLIVEFDPIKYEGAIVAFHMLEKVKRIQEVHHAAFINMATTRSIDIVTQAVASVMLQKRGSLSLGNIADKNTAATAGLKTEKVQQQKAPFKDLTAQLNEPTYANCLRNILAAFFDIMDWNIQLAEWLTLRARSASETADQSRVDLYLEIRGGLEKGRRALWEDMQRKLSAYISAKSMGQFHVDTVLRVTGMLNKIINFGDAFSSHRSVILRTTIKTHLISFLKVWQLKKLEDLRAMVEIDPWQACPLEPGFSIRNFKQGEFTGPYMILENPPSIDGPVASSRNNESASAVPSDKQTILPASPLQSHEEIREHFQEFKKAGHPFTPPRDENTQQQILAALESDRRAPLVEKPKDDTMSANSSVPSNVIATSTVVKVARLIAKYMIIMELANSIAYEVTTGITQLVEFLARVVKVYFGRDMPKERANAVGVAIGNIGNSNVPAFELVPEESVSGKVTSLFVRLKELFPEVAADGKLIESGDSAKRICTIPPVNEGLKRSLNSSGSLFGLVERVTAAESLVYLGQLLHDVQDDIEIYFKPASSTMILQFYSQTIDCFPDMRLQIYRRLARRLISFDPILQAMCEVKWDINEIPVENSKYINTLLTEFRNFQQRLSAIPVTQVPKHAIHVIWEALIRASMYVLVEGMSRAKKCSNEGRALMQLDLKVYQSGLEKITTIRPIPHTEYAQTYIKAFYLSEADADTWLRTHREYSAKQLISLISIVPALSNSKVKKRFLAAIDEGQKSTAK